MNFPIDESADTRLADYLSQLGHDVRLVARDYGSANPDRQVLAIAERERRILITNDRDFGELVFRHLQPHAGVIYFRLFTYELDAYIRRLSYVLTHHADQLDKFLVVSDNRVRSRTARQL
jgi:predicted nuclease of predicted toxin-antitoxin system